MSKPRFCGLFLVALALSLVASASANAAVSPMKVYFIDVEGGQATLFVTAQKQSLLIDTGWDGHNGRDADRIVAKAKAAGLDRIDYVLFTHFHEDHVGGAPQLAARIPIGTFIDHGPNREANDRATERVYEDYQKLLAGGKYKHLVAKAGDKLPIPGIQATVISADGELIAKPLPGAGAQNEFCKVSAPRPADQTENARSLGTLITVGKLRVLDLGDLTWDKEMQLMCPVNKLGRIDVLIVSHHGWEQSSSPALVHAIHPRVAIMDNGEKKGGSTPVLDTVRSSPGLETLWQLHYSAEGGDAHNTAAEYIANPLGTDAGNDIELTFDGAGGFDVTNGRTKVTKHYGASK
ncbi:MAG TPA: MBL fold metallo-hydrolase [Acidobacteriaceae bacterium]|jgi:beta-lactamase superfamily II metal-dependent hydrolase